MPKLECNTDLVMDLMTRSKHGPMAEIFIVQAIRAYSKEFASLQLDPTSPAHGMDKLMQAVAIDVQERCEEFYGRHDQEQS